MDVREVDMRANFEARLEQSWTVAKASWPVLRRNPRLLILPAVSAAGLFGAVAAFIDLAGGFKASAEIVSDSFHNISYREPRLILGLVGLGAVGWMLQCVALFFNAALVSCLLRGFAGETPNIGAGLAAARARLPQIVGWAFVSAAGQTIVALGRQWLGEKLGFLGDLLGGAATVGYAAATYFCLPVIVHEGAGPVTAVKRSCVILRQAWGEAAVGGAGLGALSTLCNLPAIVMVLAGMVLTANSPESSMIASGLLVGAMIYVALSTVILGALETTFQVG